ncbi:lariat debranching enzyme, C-terminal domain-containing protein [Hypoxylon trugodes]|uniref:lariat debranching enzyme, C-terminal domain-containing protein n=1 Tax=Hypoxylon trugodes TaxID=326681 RepID=UPI002194856B|nr:lariat debranching enzyme, C-terminal domain-containing protein [Hypoxylon trugodes]KAI1388998.1 lariat debranching enzyme, C-terminal domain-containing protein [Hypoxylon trugodes]
MEAKTYEAEGVRIAVEGCGHGTLDAIYASVANSCKARGWDGIDLLIIGGDFQATRNAADLSVMSVPAKYRQLADFPGYYTGEKKAPYLTIFIAGNHEASSYLWELYYGGWVAPNIYYLGAANVLRFGPLRIAGMSGIWKGFDYRKPHHERLPFSQDDIKSFYHVREIDIRKLLLLCEQVDIGLSHDWPRAIENHGNAGALWKMKPDFKQESFDGTLGNPAAEYVMDRLRPAYWFSAHMHCKFAAIKTYKAPGDTTETTSGEVQKQEEPVPAASSKPAAANPDEIDLDLEDDEDAPTPAEPPKESKPALPADATAGGVVSDELLAQLPASFAKPAPKQPKINPGQPVPPTITNTTTRFIALDKCLPGRKFLQLCSAFPVDPTHLTTYPPSADSKQRYRLQYDPEWLAITRVFGQYLAIGDRTAQTSADLGESAYQPMIDKERAWVDENIVQAGKLDVPGNFSITAPPHRPGINPDSVDHQPDEYTNPQTTAFCELLGVPNLWDASPEERAERKAAGPPVSEPRNYNQGGGRGGRNR